MKLFINPNEIKSHIEPEVYGHFSEHLGRCVYEGMYVGHNSQIPNVNGMRCDVVEALKKIKIPMLRWPGGCFASEYHWRDGIGSKENRRVMVNTTWGMVTDDNSFGTHEFMELCNQLGCKAYVNGNISSGTVQEMSEWVEYLTGPKGSTISNLRGKNGHEDPYIIDYFGVGNEPWGDGLMTPEYYSNLYRNYSHYLKQHNSEHKFKLVCSGHPYEMKWTHILMKECKNVMDYISLHFYVSGDVSEGQEFFDNSATDFTEHNWYYVFNQVYKVDDFIKKHEAIMDIFDPENKVAIAVDEYGTWFNVEEGTNPGFLYQQNTVRDAVTCALFFDIFNKYSKRVKMGAIAQLANVLQALVLTHKEKMILTPTYHIFRQYACHQGADYIETYLTGNKKIGVDNIEVPNISRSVSIKDGIINISLSNVSAEENKDIEIVFDDFELSGIIESTIVNGEKINSHNTFDEPNNVYEKEFSDYTIENNKIKVKIPSHSVILLRVK